MVQVFSPSPRAMQAGQIGHALGVGVGKNFVDPQQMVQRGLLQNALKQAKFDIKQPGATPLDKMFSVMEAGAGIPGSERYMGALLPIVQKLSEAEASQNTPLGIPDQQNEEINQSLKNFLSGGKTQNPTQQTSIQPGQQQQNPFYPNAVGQQQPIGNLPQAATGGFKQPVLSNQDLLKASKPYAAQKTAAGIPTTPVEAYEELKAINADNIAANDLVEKERKERVQSQRDYGNLAASELQRVLPNASGEELGYIKKQVEQSAGENASEADIQRLAAAEARKYKNMLSKVESDVGAIRSYAKPWHKLMGSDKTAAQTSKDLRVKIQPLLDAGLYDKARNVLSEAGLYPEEREMVITDLGENTLKYINQMPRVASTAEQGYEDGYSVKDKQTFKDNLKNILVSDPSTNLILLRGKYDLEKGLDWRTFKDALNENIENGTFKPNEDQFNQLNTLDEPPLNYLNGLLNKLGIIGR